MKRLLKIALSLVALTVAGIVGFFIYFDTIVGAAIETGCTKALGVKTRVGWVRIGLLTGDFQIGRLRIDNPPGFETVHFFSFDRVHFEVPPASLREDTIVVRLFEIDGVDVSLETADGKTNYGVILANLERFSSSGSADPSAKEAPVGDEGSGKGLVIREAVIRDITARIDLGKVEGDADRVEVEIPEIRLRPNQATGSAEASVAELTHVVVTAVLTAIAKKVPVAVAKGLLEGVSSLGGVRLKIPGARSEAAGGLGAAAKKLGEGAASALEGLGGLFGGGDEEK